MSLFFLFSRLLYSRLGVQTCFILCLFYSLPWFWWLHKKSPGEDLKKKKLYPGHTQTNSVRISVVKLYVRCFVVFSFMHKWLQCAAKTETHWLRVSSLVLLRVLLFSQWVPFQRTVHTTQPCFISMTVLNLPTDPVWEVGLIWECWGGPSHLHWY